MNRTEKLADCMRIANEYRAIADVTLAAHLEDEEGEHKLTLRNAFPSAWSPTLGGKLLQIFVVPLVLLVTLTLILVIAPIARLLRRNKVGRTSIEQGRELSLAALQIIASSIESATFEDFWRAHGLPERASQVSFDSRLECVERWMDVLYGKGVSVVTRVRIRVNELMEAQANASAAFSAAGGSISFVDPIDAVVGELSDELPPVGRTK